MRVKQTHAVFLYVVLFQGHPGWLPYFFHVQHTGLIHLGVFIEIKVVI